MSAKVAEIFDTMEYGPAPETEKTALQWLDQKDRTIGHFINGKWVVPAKSKWFDTLNPATNEKLAKVACGTKADVDAAVKAAKVALKKWQALDNHARAKCLYALARLIQKNSRLLAVLETLAAKMRIFRVPEFLAAAFLLAVLGMLVHLLLASGGGA